MLFVFLLSCASERAEPAGPRLAVVVPLGGDGLEKGRAAIEGARFAAGFAVDVLAVDEEDPAAFAAMEADPSVLAAVAHLTESGVRANEARWRASSVPVVLAAPGEFEGLARAVPPPSRAARCAAAFVPPGSSLRSDNNASGMATATALAEVGGFGALEVVDGAAVSSHAARAGDTGVAWVGGAASGGNYLRALRQLGSTAPFIAFGAYDERFLTAAGRFAEGAVVTSTGRAARDEGFLRSWIVKHGTPPSAPAIDAFDAASLLMAAMAVGGPTREGIRAALPTVQATGAAGSMKLDASLVVSPVVCASFTVREGRFELLSIVEEPPHPEGSQVEGGR